MEPQQSTNSMHRIESSSQTSLLLSHLLVLPILEVVYKAVEIEVKYSKVENIRSLTILTNKTDWKGSSSD